MSWEKRTVAHTPTTTLSEFIFTSWTWNTKQFHKIPKVDLKMFACISPMSIMICGNFWETHVALMNSSVYLINSILNFKYWLLIRLICSIAWYNYGLSVYELIIEFRALACTLIHKTCIKAVVHKLSFNLLCGIPFYVIWELCRSLCFTQQDVAAGKGNNEELTWLFFTFNA